MISIDLTKQSKLMHFPDMQAVPTELETNSFKRIWNFMKYRRKWTIKQDYCLWVPVLHKWIFVPSNFLFDGASVPKIACNIYSSTGILLLGSVPHDFGYRYEGLIHVGSSGELYFEFYSKEELDCVLKIVCDYENGMEKASNLAVLVLSAFGFFGWNENRKKNHRLKKDFPELFNCV